ncbi:MAG: ABC transporter substrate-binding protein [Firmicutes bacterium]|nr:ABC transporter substrate-binding protein [Bacillota bacterium]
MKKIIALSLVLVISFIFLAGCSTSDQDIPESDSGEIEENASGRMLTDQAGREVEVVETVDRVVALDTGLCGIILALGKWDTVVGTTRYTVLDDLLMEVIPDLDSVPTPGTSTDVSIESLLELEPDVVIGGWEIDFIHQIEAAGMAALYVEPVTFQDQFDEVMLMGELYGEKGRASELIGWMEDKLQQIYERVEAAEPVRTLYIWGDPADPLSMGTFGGAPDIRNEMLYYAGGINVAGDIDQRWPNVALEQVLTWDPEVIIVWGWADALDPVHFLENDNWQPVTAVSEGRVYKLPRWSSWSPPEVIMVLQMAKWLHPEQTADLDPNQWLEELKDEYYKP